MQYLQGVSHMANTNSTSITKDYYDFTTDLSGDIWLIHSLAMGAKGIVNDLEWEKNNELCATKTILRQVMCHIEELADKIDQSSFKYILKSNEV